MAETLELWLVRHGETAWNAASRIQGFSNVALSDVGVLQAEALAKRIGHESFDAIYASDLERAHLTAKTVFPQTDIVLDARLREFNFGVFEGQSWKTMSQQERQQMSVWFLGPYDQRVPEGESNDDLRSRIEAFIADLPKSGRVIVFTHGGVVATAAHLVTGRPKESKWNEAGSWGFCFANTSITKLAFSELYKAILVLNDAAHLETLALPQ